jgi:hypothetical protein
LEDIIRYWVGHAGEGITDRYSKLAENVELRKEWARRAGLGFELDKVGNPAPKLPLHPKAAKPGAHKDPQADIAVKHSLVRRKPQSVIAEEVAAVEDHYVASDDDLPEIFSTPVAEEV